MAYLRSVSSSIAADSSPSRGRRSQDPDGFARFLAWLAPDPAQAAVEYEQFRRRMTRFFAARGCWEADQLADDVLDRVASRSDQLYGQYVGERARFFYGVARNVYYEHLRRNAAENAAQAAHVPPAPARGCTGADPEWEDRCLAACLETLSEEDRRLLVEYYQAPSSGRAAVRRQLAEDNALTTDNLRQRTRRIRERVRTSLMRYLDVENPILTLPRREG
jgi:DNA-directed RNA polymerase specialized sigma24 family protein